MGSAAPPPTVARGSLSSATLRGLLLGALALGFVILATVSAVATWLVERNQGYSEWVNHTYLVERQLSRFSSGFETAEAARRGFLLTRDPIYLVTYRSEVTDLPRLVERIQSLTSDNPRQVTNSIELERLLSRKLGSLEASIQAVQAGGPMPSIEVDQDTVDRIRTLVGAMVGEENRLLAIRTERQAANAEQLLTVTFVSAVLLTLLGAGAFLLVRRYAADLARSEGDLKRLNEGLEQAVRDRTADLVRANDEIQRFAYIVSHDLRSPLVNVMGFTSELEVSLKPLQALLAEAKAKAPALVSPDAAAAVEADIPESIGFIRSSTQKMDRLINAILKLSREGRRTLNPEVLDITVMVTGIVDTLTHQLQARGAEIEIETPLPGLAGDRLAVEQVFANLIENAVKYLKPGRPGRIVVRGRENGPMNLYEIEDNGRGIDPKDSERIFELFRRAGAQDQPGEGIGLAHVRAMVYRLGGLISVESALDQGATFRLSLPRISHREEGALA